MVAAAAAASNPTDHDPTALPERAGNPTHWTSILSTLAAMAACWSAAGSLGLVGHPLLRALTWIFVALALISDRPAWTKLDLRRAVLSTLALLTAVWLSTSEVPAARICGVGLALLAVRAKAPRLRTAITRAAFLFALYVFCVHAIPALWYVANEVSGVLGFLGGGLALRPLDVGIAFSGLDLLVLAGCFHLLRLRAPRAGQAALVLASCLVVNFAYLLVLSFAVELSGLVGTTSPWNLPAIGAVLQLLLAAWLLSRSPPSPPAKVIEGRPQAGWAVAATLFGIAAITPVWLTLPFGHSTLEGKKIVVYEKCFGNWDVPVHDDYGRLSIGMYGMLPGYVKLFGGDLLISKELSAADLDGADVLMLLYPHDDWLDGQLERIETFVQDGGALVVLGEHSTQEADGKARFNDILEKTGMPIAFDTAEFHIGGWLQSYDRMTHPTVAGLGDDRNEFGVVIGASIDLSWPARPILLGRWGFADPGDVAGNAMLGNRKFDTGERLGDLVLVAEQAVGDGVIVAFGDASTMTNGITMGAADFSSRLLAYLASRPSSPSAWWRQLSGLALSILLLASIRRGDGLALALAIAAFGASIHLSDALAYARMTVLPDGSTSEPNNLAYFDTTHLGRYDDESWRDDGTMGIRMTLNRNGYQLLELKDFTEARLERAGLLLSIAPRKAYSLEERRILQDFVANGGIFICTASYPDRHASEAMLADFGFEIGRVDTMPLREPQPMGFFKAPYYPFPDGKYAYVRFHEAWPISDVAVDTPPLDLHERASLDSRDVRRLAGWMLNKSLHQALSAAPNFQPARVLAYGTGNHPVMLMRRIGTGAIVVVGDSSFAHNKNLERIDGSPFDGRHENAMFWRWLLSDVRDRERWIPPHPDEKVK